MESMKKWLIAASVMATGLIACNKDKKTDNSIEAQLAGNWRGTSKTVEQWDGATLLSSDRAEYGPALYAEETYGRDSSYSYTIYEVRPDTTYKREERRGKFKVWNSYIIHTVSDLNKPSITSIIDTASYILDGRRLTTRNESMDGPFRKVVTAEFYKDE
jgi:hypothetical protein